MTNESEKIICRDCNKEFEFTAGEKAFFSSRGFPPPSRCPECRKTKKAQRNTQPGTSQPQQSQAQVGQMHDITCSECKKTTQVPFKPRNPVGVLCSECFSKKHSS